MPTYSYQCENCHYQFDIFQHFSDESLTVCPKCSQPALRKVYTPVGIVFKGSGFYATDHRSPSGQAPAAHEHTHEHGAATTENNAESKPEEKSSGAEKNTGKADSPQTSADSKAAEPAK